MLQIRNAMHYNKEHKYYDVFGFAIMNDDMYYGQTESELFLSSDKSLLPQKIEKVFSVHMRQKMILPDDRNNVRFNELLHTLYPEQEDIEFLQVDEQGLYTIALPMTDKIWEK